MIIYKNIIQKIFILYFMSFFICCNNSNNNEKNNITHKDTIKTVNEHKTKEKEITLSSDEKKARETINKFLEENIVNYNNTYISLEFGEQEEYSLIEISKFFLNAMEKAEAQGHSSKDEQKVIAWTMYKLLQQSGNAKLFHFPKGSGYALTHKFKHEINNNDGIKTSNLRFYLDSTLNKVLHVEKVSDNIVLPEL